MTAVASGALHDPATFAQGIPQQLFAELRNQPGLAWSDPVGGDRTGFWSVTRHGEVVEVSRDPETFSSAVGHIQIYDIDPDAIEARDSMIDLDPPIHTRLRRLVSAAFTPRHVQGYAAAIEARVAAALDRLEAAGGGDWVTT
ncbi:MAG: cytochrome P450, partial [Actinomycetota bacterium]